MAWPIQIVEGEGHAHYECVYIGITLSLYFLPRPPPPPCLLFGCLGVFGWVGLFCLVFFHLSILWIYSNEKRSNLSSSDRYANPFSQGAIIKNRAQQATNVGASVGSDWGICMICYPTIGVLLRILDLIVSSLAVRACGSKDVDN